MNEVMPRDGERSLRATAVASASRPRYLRLVVLIVASVAAIVGLGLWDQGREAEQSLREFEREQSVHASVVAGGLATRLEMMRTRPAGSVSTDELLAGLEPRDSSIGDGANLVLLLPPGETVFRSSNGDRVESTVVAAALAEERNLVRLTRHQAAGLRLPERTAVAGLAWAEVPGMGRWGVAVVASARSERDRQLRARWRLAIGVVFTGGLVLAFGLHALRSERRQLALMQELTLAEADKQREEQLARDGRAATMLTLAAGVAHEISTPLSVIHGRAEQLLEESGSDAQERAARLIVEQTARIDGVVRGFLRLARGGAPSLEQIDPLEVIHAAVMLVEHRFAKAGIHLDSVPPGPLPSVRGDRRLIEQALVNILLNACDACSAGGHVRLAAALDADEPMVSFVVEDDGSGIDPDLVARVREPFFSTKPPGKGTGLGLAVAGEIVKIHRGRLELQPRRPQGTRAIIRLPVAQGDSDVIA